eukprot:CAMPEP_0115001734 /NCGR_PEP_ID=MMETSP0216-20121206/17570_1 /TAXON_ID=223996 /ORGANISM="Protocruzia adherens, Strain Boccale" /LENGTH=288 /DNA_ID=CAMNT_0002367161 /DNA_START=1349 /DNA_END=2215 /DNA_ORIENTATION=-
MTHPLRKTHKTDLTVSQFKQKHAKIFKPTVITDCHSHWPLVTGEGPRKILADLYGDSSVKVAPRCFTNATPGEIKVKDWLVYAQGQHDEDPMDLADSDFVEKFPALTHLYSVPEYFPDDIYGKLGEERPPFRWITMSTDRSGSTWHQDPSATVAWNALVEGRKRWAIYPPEVIPPGMTSLSKQSPFAGTESPTQLQWYLEVYPMLSDEEKPIEFIQHPGECVYMPPNWWHMVLNLEPTFSVTHNYVDEFNYVDCMKDLLFDDIEAFYKLRAMVLAIIHPPQRSTLWNM